MVPSVHIQSNYVYTRTFPKKRFRPQMFQTTTTTDDPECLFSLPFPAFILVNWSNFWSFFRFACITRPDGRVDIRFPATFFPSRPKTSDLIYRISSLDHTNRNLHDLFFRIFSFAPRSVKWAMVETLNRIFFILIQKRKYPNQKVIRWVVGRSRLFQGQYVLRGSELDVPLL